MSSFPEQLTRARKAAGLTQQQMAEQLHVSRQTVSHWETGRAQPDEAAMTQLRSILSLPEETAAPQEAAVSVQPQKRRKALLIALIGLLCVAGVFFLFVNQEASQPAPQPTEAPQATLPVPTYVPVLPADYPLEWYLNPAPNEDSARAYVQISPFKTPVRLMEVAISPDPSWPVGFEITEVNGLSFTIDKISLLHFAADRSLLASEVYAARELQEFMNITLADGQSSDWNSLTSLQNAAYYCIAVEGTDAKGNQQSFGGAIELINELEELPVRSDFDLSPAPEPGRAHMTLTFEEGEKLLLTRGGNEYTGEDIWEYHLQLENTGDAAFSLNSIEFVYFNGEELFTKAEYTGADFAQWCGEAESALQPGEKWVFEAFDPAHAMDLLGVRIKGTDGQKELTFTGRVSFVKEYWNDDTTAE